MTPEQLKASYGRQLALLVRMLPIVARESCFAVKGGTAINLFHRELPRMSVDIDLTYLPIANRRESLDGIGDALGRIGERIESEHPYVRVKPEGLKGERRLCKLNLEQGTTKIKVEVSTVLRGCVYRHERRAMSSTAGELFTPMSIQVVSHADLYAGKIIASLSRQHPRDLYDVHGLLTNDKPLFDHMRKITEEERQHYDRHGVVHLPGLLDDDWLRRLEAAFTEEMSADQTLVNIVDFKALTPMIEASGAEFVTPGVASATGRFCISSFNWRRFPALAALCCGPPLPDRVAELIRSHRINFYGEQLFLKEAKSLHRTALLSRDREQVLHRLNNARRHRDRQRHDGIRQGLPPLANTRGQRVRDADAIARIVASAVA